MIDTDFRTLRRSVGALSIAVVTASLALPTASWAQREPLVTQAVQVTSNPEPLRAHSSPQIARNPDNGELVIVESNPRGDKEERTCNAHISTDGGQSWFPGGDMMQEPFTDCSLHGDYGPYATLAFAGDGTLYVTFVASDPRFADPATFSPQSSGEATVVAQQVGGSPLGGVVASHPPRRVPRNVFLARSTDGGRSFETTTVFIGQQQPSPAPAKLSADGENKGPMLAVDPSDPSMVYVGWRQGDLTDGDRKLETVIAASSDGGATFSEPVDVSDERGGDFPALAVTPDGTAHAVFWTRDFSPTPVPDDAPPPVAPIQHVRSTDGGQTWSDAVAIDPGNQETQRPPLLAADPDSGALYMVWYGHAEPMNAGDDFEGDLNVFSRASTDGGGSWSERLQVNDDDGGAHQFEPGISIAPDGRVDIAWYDFRNSVDGGLSDVGLSDVYYSSSNDQARSFGPDLRVNDRRIDRSIGVWSNNIDSKFNVGVTSGEDVAHVAWQDSRNGREDTNSEDVYMASVNLDGTVDSGAEETGPAAWALVAVGVALGMGIAMVVTVLLGRRLGRSRASRTA